MQVREARAGAGTGRGLLAPVSVISDGACAMHVINNSNDSSAAGVVDRQTDRLFLTGCSGAQEKGQEAGAASDELSRFFCNFCRH